MGVSSLPGLNSSDIGGIMVDYSSSDDDGGGISIAANTVYISGLTFTNAVAGGRGAAIFVAGSISGIDIANMMSINSKSGSLGFSSTYTPTAQSRSAIWSMMAILLALGSSMLRVVPSCSRRDSASSDPTSVKALYMWRVSARSP